MASKSAEKLIRTNLKFLRGDNVSAIRFRHRGNARMEDNKSFERTKLFQLLSRKKIRPGTSEASDLLKKTLPAMSTPSVNYFVMQYLFNTKNKVSFDPIGALSHFVVPGVAAEHSSEELLKNKEHSERGHGHKDGISTSEASLDITTGKVRESNSRLEILKIRAARRTSLVADGSEDTEKQESAKV